MSYRETDRDLEVEELRERLRKTEEELARARRWKTRREWWHVINKHRVWGLLATSTILGAAVGLLVAVIEIPDRAIKAEIEARATVTIVDELRSPRAIVTCLAAGGSRPHAAVCVGVGPSRTVGATCTREECGILRYPEARRP